MALGITIEVSTLTLALTLIALTLIVRARIIVGLLT